MTLSLTISRIGLLLYDARHASDILALNPMKPYSQTVLTQIQSPTITIIRTKKGSGGIGLSRGQVDRGTHWTEKDHEAVIPAGLNTLPSNQNPKSRLNTNDQIENKRKD